MPVLYKGIDDTIYASEFIVVADGEAIEPLACEAEGCTERAYHAYHAPSERPGHHHPDYLLFCDEHAKQFVAKGGA